MKTPEKKKIGRKNGRHGLSKSPFYKKYISIKDRCTNANHVHYRSYGGRGIKFEWESFLDFKNDMYASYIEHCDRYGRVDTTIDRIDSNGNYCKENCSWRTKKEQAFNRRLKATRFYDVDGLKMTIPEMSIMCGINKMTLAKRLESGWELTAAMTKRPHHAVAI